MEPGLLFHLRPERLDAELLRLANERYQGPFASIAEAMTAPAPNLYDLATHFYPGWPEHRPPPHFGKVAGQIWALVYGAFWGERACVQEPYGFPGKGVLVADVHEPPSATAGRVYLTVAMAQNDPVLVRVPYMLAPLIDRPTTFEASRGEIKRVLEELVDRVNLVLPAAQRLAARHVT